MTDVVEVARTGVRTVHVSADRPAKRFIYRLAAATAAWALLALGAIWIVDPYGVSPVKIAIPGLNVFKPTRLDIDRIIKPYEVWWYQPRTIFLGTSRIHQAINPASFDGTIFAPAYNAAVPAASIGENVAFLEQYLRTNKKLKFIFLELFVYQFISEVQAQPVKGHLDLIGSTAPLMFSTRAVFDSGLTATYNAKSQTAPPFVDRGGHWVRPASHDIGMHMIPHAYTDFVLGVHRSIPRLKLFESGFAALRRARDLCERHGVKLVFIVTPQYPWDGYRLQSLGYADFVADFYRRVAQLGEVHSFAQFNEATNEPSAANMRYWIDPLHFSPAMGDLMASALAGRSDERLPRDFMLKVTPETVDEVLRIRSASLQDWIARDPEFGARFDAAKVLLHRDRRATGTLDIPARSLTVDGQTYEIISGPAAVEVIARTNESFTISGWIADATQQDKRAADAVVATVGSRVVAKWFPTTGRWDVEQAFGTTVRPAGFVLRLPEVPAPSAGPIRIFGLLAGGRAVQAASGFPEVTGAPFAQ